MKKFTEPVAFWLTPLQKQRLKRAARTRKLPLSTMMRDLAVNTTEAILDHDIREHRKQKKQ